MEDSLKQPRINENEESWLLGTPLPTEVILDLLEFFTFQDLCILQTVNHAWSNLISKAPTWRKLLHGLYPSYARLTEAHSQENSALSYKDHFERVHRVSCNWKKVKPKRSFSIFENEEMAYVYQTIVESSVNTIHGQPRLFAARASKGVSVATLPSCLSQQEDSSMNVKTIGANLCKSYGKIFSIALEQTHNVLFGGFEGGAIALWNLEEPSQYRIVQAHRAMVRSMSLQETDKKLATGSMDASIKIWDLNTMQVVKLLTGHTHMVQCLEFVNPNTLISGGCDSSLKIWDIRSGTHQSPSIHSARVRGIQISNDGTTIYSCGIDGKLAACDLRTGKLVNMVTASAWLRCLCLKEDILFVGGDVAQTMKARNCISFGEIVSLSWSGASDARNTCVSTAADETRVFAGTHSGQVFVWDFDPYMKGH